MKKRRTVADSVANIGESGDRDRCLGTSAEEVGTDHVSDHALIFSSDVSMERMYRLSF